MSIHTLLARWHSVLPELMLVHDPNQAPSQLIQKIQTQSDQNLCGGVIQHRSLAQAVRAGFLLAAGGLEEAHVIVQALDMPEAFYWHGIVHRREPDWSNGKYWFRQLGHHPIFDELTMVIDQDNLDPTKTLFPGGAWDPFRFIDLCKEFECGQNQKTVGTLLKLQQYEIEVLLDYCVSGALH